MYVCVNRAGETGSYLYMAPECMLSKPYNEKVDIFSLAVILFEVWGSYPDTSISYV